METKNIPTVKRELVTLENLKNGDIFYLSQKPDAPPYLVLDGGGSQGPFILIENQRTHFANLWRVGTMYKEVYVCQ